MNVKQQRIHLENMLTPLEYTVHITVLDKKERTQGFTWSIKIQETPSLLLIGTHITAGALRPWRNSVPTKQFHATLEQK
jgi:hypothetical protein